ncbi:complexed with Cdc5 protein Cwf20 [Schizosaccharomyces japonicus yFS275]|uniref:Complexed with Cdc5 protein Cwf20 n=1 Tax=Schizosaccharomyces japonicus (strain yFS275 / FY16936) TaxID=402676 RepID=B6JZV4_SCHJY|nr:complexed with Cdc5 protein Cwf20 [Schizosaccharomyces japonicus yFS275]EEB06104.1 complexed with Cdc5 protein Cwf20 [Schizosaccharomyces japonicus yFS275]
MNSLVDYESSDSEVEESSAFVAQLKEKSMFVQAPKKISDKRTSVKKIAVEYGDLDEKESASAPIASSVSDNVSLSSILVAPKKNINLEPEPSIRTDLVGETTDTSTAEPENFDDITSFLPTSVSNRQKNKRQALQTSTLFPIVPSTAQKKESPSDQTVHSSYEPVFLRPTKRTRSAAQMPINTPEVLTETTAEQSIEDRITQLDPKASSKHARFIDVDMNKIYEQNMATMSQPIASASIKSVAPGRHQLSSLVSMATLQKDNFEAHFAQERQKKRDTAKKYGF